MQRILWVATLALLLVGVGTSTGFAQSPGDDESAEEVASRAAAIAEEARRQREAAAGAQGVTTTQPAQPQQGDGTGLSVGAALSLATPVNNGSSEGAEVSRVELVLRYMLQPGFGLEGAVGPGLWWTEAVSPFHAAARLGVLVKVVDTVTIGAGAGLGIYQNPNDRPPHYGAAELYLAPGLQADHFVASLKVAYTFWSELERLNGGPGLGLNVGWMF